MNNHSRSEHLLHVENILNNNNNSPRTPPPDLNSQVYQDNTDSEFSGNLRNHPRSHSRSFSWSHTALCANNNPNSMAALFSPIRVIQGIVPNFTNTGVVNNTNRVPPSPSRTQLVDVRSANQSAHIRTRSDASRGHSRHSSTVEINIGGDDLSPPPSPVDNNGSNSNRTQDQLEFLGAISWIEKAIPFLILLSAKIMWDHRLGILVFIGLFGTFFHVNSTIKKQVALKERRMNRISLGIFIFLFVNIFFIYFVFKNQNLENCLIFQAPNLNVTEVWEVIWCVGITDFVIRFVDMGIKCSVIILPRRLVNFRKRGKYFLIIEHLTQFYRMIIPIPHWYRYFSNYDLGGEYFSFMSTTAYAILKGRHLFNKMKEVRMSFHCYWKDTRYGGTPNKEVMLENGDSCPICQETMEDPIELNHCKHIFCEECIIMWFDRERTCPMCRAKIAEDPQWRDGNTQSFIQLF